MDTTIQAALANEARRQELKQKIAKMQGAADAMAQYASLISMQSNDSQKRLADAQAKLAALEAGAGPGVTADFGKLSQLEQALRDERYAGKKAVVEFVKVSPECSEAAALDVYRSTALSARPGASAPLIDPAELFGFYRQELVSAGKLPPGATWEQHRDFIVATPEADLGVQ